MVRSREATAYVVGWVCKPILVLSFGLSQAEQKKFKEKSVRNYFGPKNMFGPNKVRIENNLVKIAW